MAAGDRSRWDVRYTSLGTPPDAAIGPPACYSTVAAEFPRTGTALDIACGQGGFAVWLAGRGMDVWGVDVSPVAVEHAATLARRHGVAQHCRFDVADLDDGLPPGPPVDVLVCHLFRDRRLDDALVERLVPGGLLAIAALSEVGAPPGRFRAQRGELLEAFGHLEVIAADERDGTAWLLARR